MTNDEIPNDERMTNSEARMAIAAVFCWHVFGIRHSCIRASFVIGYFVIHSSFMTIPAPEVALSN